ncbi:MAG: outer membrane protein assembly factor BamA [Spirochaetia bacterium]|nr:outer membrane protein assembly factor BamA [Spirochaetia bacterium]
MKRIVTILILLVVGNAVFAQTTPDWYVGKPIKDIRFDGLIVVPSKDLSPLIKEFKGKEFSDELWMSLLARVYELDYFESVEPEAVPSDAAGKAVIIMFRVKEKPAVTSVSLVGNTGLRSQEILDSLSVKERTIFNDSRLRLDEIALRRLYQSKGFPDVTVVASSEVQASGNLVVTFTIDEGIRNVVESLQFEGVESISQNTLKRELKLKEKGLFQPGEFNEGKLEESRRAVETYYKNRGYVDARIVDVRREATPAEKGDSMRLSLTFVVEEGRRYLFGGLGFTGNTLYSDEELGALVRQPLGSVFNYDRLMQDQSRAADLYFENGYIFNGFKLLDSRDEERGQISYTLEIEERPQAHIEDIIFRGNTKTKEFVLRRLVSLEPGEIFSKTKVLESLKNLYNTQYFSSIIPEYEQGSQDLYVDLIIGVEEQSTASIQFGLTYAPSTAGFPIIGLVNWSDINFRGAGQTIALKTNLAIESQDLSFSFSDDWLFGKRLSGAVEFSFKHENLSAFQDSSGVIFDYADPSRVPDPYDNYAEYEAAGKVVPDTYLMQYDTWTFSLGYSSGYRFETPFGTVGLVPGVNHELGTKTYKADLYRPFDFTIATNLNTWLTSNTIYGRAYINKLDLWYDPSNGYYASQRLGLTGWFNGELNQFIRSDTRLDAYVTLFNIPFSAAYNLKGVLGAHSKFSTIVKQPWRDGIAVSDSKMLSIDGTFVGRGWSSLSGYSGSSLWDNWLELRLPVVPSILSLDGFISAALVGGETGILDVASLSTGGAAYDNGAMKLGDFAFSTGVGLRFIIIQFPFRVYFAKQFVYDEGTGFKFTDKDWQFVLSVTTSLD